MEKITFNSKDGLLMTADYYPVNGHKGMILLCHRSHCNRAEYRETAPKFNALGYACLAIDQRSGMKVFGESNETKDRAKASKLPTGYLDARPDVEAGIEYAYKLNKERPIILLGSSYTAALALLIASDSVKQIQSLIVFSPDEHLKQTDLASKLGSINIPIFATSARSEIKGATAVLRNIQKKYVNHFKPSTEGFHGSKILWESVKGYEKVWDALKIFLSQKSKSVS